MAASSSTITSTTNVSSSEKKKQITQAQQSYKWIPKGENDKMKKKKKKKSLFHGETQQPSLSDIVLSWTLNDIFNEHLYKDKVKVIPETFSSVGNYLNSYRYPLLEETHADLLSSMMNLSHSPTCDVLFVEENEDFEPPHNFVLYNIMFDVKKHSKSEKEIYQPQVWDLIAFSDVRPVCVNDLNRPKRSYLPALIVRSLGEEEDVDPDTFIVLASKPIVVEQDEPKKRESLFIISLINMTTNMRIWKVLGGGNTKIIKEVLHVNSMMNANCDLCAEKAECIPGKDIFEVLDLLNLNKSQFDAVLSSTAIGRCNHKSSVKLIWGPPGTGKTKTVGTLLWALLKMKCRTLTCAPTNIAVVEVTSRLMSLVRQTFQEDGYGLGDILLFGNKNRMKIDDHSDLHDVFLDYRAKRLSDCFVPLTGWKHRLQSMIWLLEDSFQQYLLYLEDRKIKKAQDVGQKNEMREVEDVTSKVTLTFCKYIRNSFCAKVTGLRDCIKCFCIDLPTSILSARVMENMNTAITLLEYLRTSLDTGRFTDGELQNIFSESDDINCTVTHSSIISLRSSRNECLQILRCLDKEFSLPNYSSRYLIRKFCLESTCLIFCTASSSDKLYLSKPVELVVIDEAAQLKECESAIPLQLPGAHHAILIGDEKQLPAMVQSKISEKAGFGRSLFERLASLGHKRHLLNVQYRMHPSISLFPNSEFYSKKIYDAPNVKEKGYRRDLLHGNMYGTYSFIDVSYGKEEFDDGHSRKNMVEVAVVSEIVANLYQASLSKGQKVSVGVISPYKAQVFALTAKLRDKYNANKDFSVSVRSVDGFQGGEEDVIIISTVRSNGNGSVGFLSNRQRTNVAVTRARYCLWFVGNGTTLSNNNSVWKKIVVDAKNRGCYFIANEDNRLAKAIIYSMVELDQLDDFLNINSLLFKDARWKVIFADVFWKSLVRIKDIATRKKIVDLLMKLSSGWRYTRQKLKKLEVMDGTSAELLEQYRINGQLNLLWSVDILKENSIHIQVLKFWDILPVVHIPSLKQRLDIIFGSYTVDNMNRCKFKCLDGTLEVPMSWEFSGNVVGRKNLEEIASEKLSTQLASLSLGKKQNPAKLGSRTVEVPLSRKMRSKLHRNVVGSKNLDETNATELSTPLAPVSLGKDHNTGKSGTREQQSSQTDIKNERSHSRCPKKSYLTQGVGCWQRIIAGTSMAKSFIRFQVQSGSQVRLWLDNWVDGGTLAELYPHLFLISKQKFDPIAAFVSTTDPSSWNFTFTRQLSQEEEEDLVILKAIVGPTTALNDQEDQRLDRLIE